jgi:hypothetical protein
MLALAGCTDRQRIVSGGHGDEGPADRYRVPYEPITYGQSIDAPLPGLAMDYKLVDWDEDGLVDLLATIRRGKGLVWYRNIGTPQSARFRSLEENAVLLPDSRVSYFDVIDYDGDGKRELAAYAGPGGSLLLYRQTTKSTTPKWEHLTAVDPEGDTIRPAPESWASYRISAADWDGDGRQDLIVAYEDVQALVPESTQENKRQRVSGFRDTAAYHPHVGRIAWLRNLSKPGGPPVFAREQPILADEQPIRTYVFPYPLVYDLDRDGRQDLIVGSHDTRLRFFRNTAPEGEPVLKDAGLLGDEDGQSPQTFLTIRVQPADLDGDGEDELVGTSYYGNNDRYLVYQRAGAGWRHSGHLSIRASPTTPVYGMGISTVDPVDWDGDGDTDLLLGAEGGFPTIVINSGSEDDRRFEPARRLIRTDGRPLETRSIQYGDGSHWGPLEWYSDRIAPRAVDWDGDGVLDLISGSMGRRLYFFRGHEIEGDLRFNEPLNFRTNGQDLVLPDRLFPGVTDWNGDGLPDLLVSTEPGHIVVYPGNRSLELGRPDTLRHATTTPIILQDFWERKKGNRSGFTVADWDGDGHRDLVIYQFHRGIFLFRNTGDDTFGPEELLVPLYSHLAGPSVMDWDRDGYPDLLVGGDERRMIEPARPAHLVVYRGQNLDPPAKLRRNGDLGYRSTPIER